MSPAENVSKGTSLLITVLIAALVSAVTAFVTTYFSQHAPQAKVVFNTPYQAVQLNNGAAYFCKIQGLGTPFPVLTEIYYIQRNQNAETKQITNVLLKRGSEWWQPDRMVVNASDIVFVEPVSPNSRVAELIAEEKMKK
jgi:hypothetical protein